MKLDYVGGSVSQERQSRTEKEAQRLTRLILTARDLRYALSAATFLRFDVGWEGRHTLEEMRRYYCYETTMVVAYGRPFSNSRGGVAPFAWKHAGLRLTPEEAALHEKLLTYRNKLHAHSDADFVEVRREILRTDLGNGKFFDFLFTHSDESLRFTEVEVGSIHDFLRKARTHVERAIQATNIGRDALPVQVLDLGEEADRGG